MKDKARKITAMGALCALAYTATAVGRVPLVLFLKYDPKDAVIAAGGLVLTVEIGRASCRERV